EIFGPPQRVHVPKVRHTICRSELKQRRYGASRLVHSAREHRARCGHEVCGSPIGGFAYCLCGRRCRFIMMAREELRKAQSGLHLPDERVERTEAHGSREILDRLLRLTEPACYNSTEMPCGCEVWVENDSTLNQGSTVFNFANQEGERQPRPRTAPPRRPSPGEQHAEQAGRSPR